MIPDAVVPPSPTQSGPFLREATPDDAAEIAAIYAPEVLAGTASYEEAAPDAGEMARRMAEVRARGLPWLVAVLNGRIAGYAYAGPFRARPAYRHTVENSVYVADWARGNGIAGMLMADLIARCTDLGHRRMIAVIGDSRNLASAALHRRHGFAEVGVIPGAGAKFGGWLDLLIMQRALGDGNTTAPPSAGTAPA